MLQKAHSQVAGMHFAGAPDGSSTFIGWLEAARCTLSLPPHSEVGASGAVDSQLSVSRCALPPPALSKDFFLSQSLSGALALLGGAEGGWLFKLLSVFSDHWNISHVQAEHGAAVKGIDSPTALLVG